jgi:MFS transporter, FSR family, fosmidomycin resistance protein
MKNPFHENAAVWSLAVTHGIIDLSCVLSVYNAALIHGLPQTHAVALVLAYDLIAFALQPIAGLLIDKIDGMRTGILGGIALTAFAVLLVRTNPVAAMVAAGLGNALFHTGAGARILVAHPRKTSQAGIFVGPGAIGLSAGFWYGTHGFFPNWQLVVSLAIAAAILVPQLKRRTIPVQVAPGTGQVRPFPGIALLLLAAIAIRGFVGRTGFVALPFEPPAVIGLGCAACLGKMSGGLLADRFGWEKIAIGAPLAAGILMAFIGHAWWIALGAMLLFQMSMPVTLVATYQAIPKRPAFAFGMTCLALIIGTIPAYYAPSIFSRIPLLLALIAVSAVCIGIGLVKLNVRFGIAHGKQSDEIRGQVTK